MARKGSNAKKTETESANASHEVAASVSKPAETVADTPVFDEPQAPKSKSKPTEEQASAGSVGISDIRKAVAFANSVGGLDRAIGLLQIVKVAKEVQ